MSPNCPRCGSTKTKFCYYNNYSLSQPRFFCKGCRRYWTKGGSLRNIPVGGGFRRTPRRSNKPPLRLTTTTITNSNQPLPSSSNSTIDLAKVYANFLSPEKPKDQDHQVQNTRDGNERVVGELDAVLMPPFSGQDEFFMREVMGNVVDNNNNTLQPTMLQENLEAGAQISSLFDVDECWNALDLFGYVDDEILASAPSSSTGANNRQQQGP